MLNGMRRSMAKILLGDNLAMLRTYERVRTSVGKAAAVVAVLYLQPVRKLLNHGKFIREYDFVMSPEYYRKLHGLLHIAQPEGFELVRLGKDYDGGYIMLDDFGHDDGIAYSFGISDDVSWDKDMAARGYDVFMYDHTINGLPEENPRFHFFRQGISDGKTQDDRLKTLEELIAHNHHEDKHNMILKMDVEGAEWGFLENVSPDTLKQFSQIMFEFHYMNRPEFREVIIKTMNKLNKTHQLVHLHGQNHGYYICTGGKTFCNQIEVSYVRRDRYNLIEDYDVSLPLSIDMPAHSYIAEVELGQWNRQMNVEDDIASIVTIM